MQFTPINRDELPKSATRENTASAKLFADFIASGQELAKLDLDEGAKMASVRSTLQNYTKRHDVPVRVFTRGTDLYLETLTAEQVQEIKAKEAERASRKANKVTEAPAEATAPEAELANA